MEESTTCAPDPLNQLYEGKRALGLHVGTSLLPTQKNSNRWACTRVGSFLFISLTPGRQQNSLWSVFNLRIRPSVPFRREYPMTMTCLFLICWSCLTFMRPPSQDELSSSVLFSSTYRVSYLLHIGTWEGRIVTKMCLLPWAGTCNHCPLPFRSLWSAIYFLQGFPFFPPSFGTTLVFWACLREWRKWF